jgi:hypothetical protein
MFKKIANYGEHLTDYHASFVDKLSAKCIVKKICGDKIEIPNVIRVLDSPNDITINDLNPKHIIKSAHASGWNVNIDSTCTIDNIKNRLVSWNTKFNANKEKQYNYIEPKFFIEEKIDDKILGCTGDALVYMFRCIYSKPISIGVKYKKAQNSYDIHWNPKQEPKIPFEIPKPNKLEEMLKLATLLSSEFEFVRIDFYIDKDDAIYFSEFTFTPAGGSQVYDIQTEHEQGSLWTI